MLWYNRKVQNSNDMDPVRGLDHFVTHLILYDNIDKVSNNSIYHSMSLYFQLSLFKIFQVSEDREP